VLTGNIDLVLCGHSLGAGVAAMLGMVRVFSVHFLERANLQYPYVDVGRPEDLSYSPIQWPPSR